MAKHPTARRVHRQGGDDDVFVAGVLEGGVWAKTHGRVLTIVGVATLVFLAGFIYYRNFKTSTNDKAAVELTGVRQTVLQGNKQLAMRDLRTFVSKFGNTPSGDEARLLLAQVYMELEQPSSAVEVIKPLASDPGKSNGASAALIMGAAYEASKQLDKAEQAYLKVADEAHFGFEKREALERAANLRITRGNLMGAAELYDRAMKTLPEDSDQRFMYQMRIAEVTASGARTGS